MVPDGLEAVRSEIYRIKEAVRILKPLKSLDQYELLGELEDLIAAFEKQPVLETAKDIENFRHKRNILEGKQVFQSIFSYEISVYGDRISLDRLLGKLRDATLRNE